MRRDPLWCENPGTPRTARIAAAVAVALALAALSGPVRLTLRDVVPSHRSPPARTAPAARPGFDPADVVERVSHRVASDPDRTASLVASDDAYRARFDRAGFALGLPGDTGEGLRVTLRDVSRQGWTAGHGSASAWDQAENVARRTVAPGVVEQVTARDGELEWDVVLDRPPPGRGDLRVRADVAGAVGRPTESHGQLRFALADGRIVRMGELVVLDARGDERHRALPSVEDGVLQLEVPDAALEGATYPLTIDPTVGPEKGVVAAPDDQRRPVAATAPSNGEDPDITLVVWEDERNGNEPDIRGAHVLPDGAVLEPDGFPITSDFSTNERDPTVAWVPGSGFLVVWEVLSSSTGTDLWGIKVGRLGGVVGSAVTVSNTPSDERDPAVAANGTGTAVVVWNVNGVDVTGARVNGSGSVEAFVSVGSSGQKSFPAIAWSGSRFLVVWQAAGTDIRGARLDGNGALVSNITVSVAAGTQSSPTAAWNGTHFLVAWYDARNGGDDIFGARITNGGTVVEPAGIPVSIGGAGAFAPSAVALGSTFLVAWARSPGGKTPLATFVTRVAADGTVQDTSGLEVSAAELSFSGPAIAPSAGRGLVVWSDGRLGAHDVFGARITTSGTVLDPQGITVSTLSTRQRDSAVGFNGTNFFVAWTTVLGPFTVRGALVGPGGRILRDTSISLGSTAHELETRVAVASDGNQFLVVWDGVHDIDNNRDIGFARVNASGALSGSPFSITTVEGNEIRPAVAWTGSSFLVAWEDDRNGVDLDVFASRVSSSGTVLDGPGGRAVVTAAGDQDNPDVAGDGSGALVVWEDGRTGGGSEDVRAARVTGSTGAVGASFVVSGVDHRQDQPAVAWNGARHLVTWRDNRGGSVTTNVFGARVTSTGTVQDATGIPISTQSGNQEAPDVAANGSTFLVAWRDNRASGYNLYGTRVTDAGGVQDGAAGFLLSGRGGDEDPPSLSPAAGGWGLTYERDVTFNGVAFRSISAK